MMPVAFVRPAGTFPTDGEWKALEKALGMRLEVDDRDYRGTYEGAKHFESDWGARLPEALLWLESRYRPEGRN